jgi:hypothetical protein
LLYSGGIGVALAAENGFAQISAFDTNHDGVLNAQVKVWQDINQNGVSDAGKLKTLAQLNIASINIAGADFCI